ncbi:prolipoprotein diacylglyceryl transferase [Intrasporangium calvum]|uniref:Phosphatidylglycerol--prolipoprotein diacylglyceryl transferase n=1 Tax=Intrasporangium calvum (strain ATCC 23552 / DSM 43043 / JCM 3097 / NBRC 12989 / NCIMB 10167 / NRRL B-3866 / 7 KIP) TaxID=710696 RepID=E6SBF8_INTC7|nr:prolipoprotein diacylglyceryl transferase [Intrasporangium calvum]ADU49486.1 prolipoprotein diacylglyceryl transferase [Intrasporangium calvum DSM 43043]AXG14413.1 prolipoprotein diacylglyceryl transferase [Intrasporangium calvum]
MQPVLFSILGFDVQTYGVSKALAAWVAAVLLARAFEARGLDRERAYSFVLWSTVWGFAGAKVYFLLEQLPTLTVHDFGGMGFTWYGGLIAGTLAAVVMVRRWELPLGAVAGAAAVPMSVGYAVGRLGCLLSGDGTYGRPTTLPWGMTFPNGVVATDVPVHPTPLYEAIGALVIAAILWWLGRRTNGPTIFAGYLILSSAARLLVEFLRTNSPAFLGLTQPQLWAVVGIAAGALLAWVARRRRREEQGPVGVPSAEAGMSDREPAGLAR